MKNDENVAEKLSRTCYKCEIFFLVDTLLAGGDGDDVVLHEKIGCIAVFEECTMNDLDVFHRRLIDCRAAFRSEVSFHVPVDGLIVFERILMAQETNQFFVCCLFFIIIVVVFCSSRSRNSRSSITCIVGR